jgi:hypothetical protein
MLLGGAYAENKEEHIEKHEWMAALECIQYGAAGLSYHCEISKNKNRKLVERTYMYDLKNKRLCFMRQATQQNFLPRPSWDQ